MDVYELIDGALPVMEGKQPHSEYQREWYQRWIVDAKKVLASHIAQQSVSRSTTLAPDTQIKCAGKAIWCSAQDGENCTLEYGRCPGQRI